MPVPEPGDTLIVTTNSAVDERGFIFVETIEGFSGLCFASRGEDLPVGSEIEVMVMRKDSGFRKDFKCRYPVPEAKPAKVAAVSEPLQRKAPSVLGEVKADMRGYPAQEVWLRQYNGRGKGMSLGEKAGRLLAEAIDREIAGGQQP